MTVRLTVRGTNKTIIVSDTHYKAWRTKPTLSVYDAETNCETKLASFNNEDAFKQFAELLADLTQGVKSLREL